jgi:glyoxylase-like metal-dependent hydrolase (beta-lactamase superfamily II)
MMSTYSGKVVPGGPPAVRELTHLIITKASVGPMDNNTYVLRCRDTDDELVIDAAAEPERIIALCGEGPLTHVITTHRHPDHWQALAEVVARTGAVTVSHSADAPAIPVPTDELVADGDHVLVGRCDLEVIHLVGHTPGSIALLYDDPTGPPHLWTGDSLFPGGIGNTHGNRQHFEQLIADVTTKVFDRLPDETWVYPGHGNDTMLGAERPYLAQWRERGW